MHLSVSDIARKVFFVFAFTVPFSHAFALHRWLPIPMVVLFFGLASVTIIFLDLGHLRYEAGCFRCGDLWLVLFLIWMGVSLILNGDIPQKSLNHLCALTTVACMYYFFVKLLLAVGYGSKTATSYHIRALIVPVAITTVFVCLEFVDSNFAGFGIKRFLLYAEDIGDYGPSYAGMFCRARGFTSESGNLALFLNAFSPLVIAYYLERKRYGRGCIAFVLYMAALTFSFSVAGICSLLCALAVSTLVYIYDHRCGRVSAGVVVLGLLICLSVLTICALAPERYLSPAKNKLLLSATYSSQDRMKRWLDALDSIKQHPICGTGIGSTSAEYGTGVVSLYLLLLREGGIVAFGLFIAFAMGVFHRVVGMPKAFNYKYAYIISLVAVLLHYAVVSDFWLPWIWVLFAIVACDLALFNKATCTVATGYNGSAP